MCNLATDLSGVREAFWTGFCEVGQALGHNLASDLVWFNWGCSSCVLALRG